MRDHVITALDTLAVLLIAAGLGAAVFPWLGWAALVVAGVAVLTGSLGAQRLGSRPARKKQAV